MVGVDNDGVTDDGAPAPGPDERDLDLLDGSWEQRYYRGETRRRDWTNINLGLSLVILMAILVPIILVVAR